MSWLGVNIKHNNKTAGRCSFKNVGIQVRG